MEDKGSGWDEVWKLGWKRKLNFGVYHHLLMCLNGVTCLPADCSFSELALYKIKFMVLV